MMSSDGHPLEKHGMRIAVIGPGALGTLFAARLAISGVTTLLFDHRVDRAKALTTQGLRLLDASGTRHVRVPVISNPGTLASIDAAIVLVKSYQTDAVASLLAEVLPASAFALTLQNGLGNVETLRLHLGTNRVFGGTTAQGSLMEAPGIVRDTGSGPTVLGTARGLPDPRLDDLCQVLMQAGFAVSITDNLPAAVWNKVILNAAINPVGALTRLRNGELAEHEPSLKLMTAVARESDAIARRHGIELMDCDWPARLHAVCQATSQNRNSMLQDVLQGRRTEIDAINGAITRTAEQHKLTAPINRTLWYLINAIDAGRRDERASELS